MGLFIPAHWDQWGGCGGSMDRAPDCSPAGPGFDPSLGQFRHPQPWRPSLGKRTRVPRTCDRCGSAVQTSAEEEEDCPHGTEITAVKAGDDIRWNSAEMVSANVGEWRWMYEEMMTLLGMEGRSWQSPTPKQQLPRTETMGKPSTHNIVSRMTEEGWLKKAENPQK